MPRLAVLAGSLLLGSFLASPGLAAAPPAPAPTVGAASAARVNSGRFVVSATVASRERGTLHWAARVSAGRSGRGGGGSFAGSARIALHVFAARGVRSAQLVVTVTDAHGHRWSFVRDAGLARAHGRARS